jgi:ribonucleoside-diphosphate reductase alpha chain
MPERRRLPDERRSVTRKLSVRFVNETGQPDELDIYVHVGLYEDGSPGELFLRSSKMGSTVSGFMDAVAMCVSMGLQHGIPLEAYLGKLIGMRFPPSGVGGADFPFVASPLDAVARWLRARFLPRSEDGSTST